MSAPLRFPSADVFIETGYGTGETLEDVVQGRYEQIHSIEISSEVVAEAPKNFAAYPQVTIHFGSSPGILPSLCDPDRETVFWLDAHYSGGAYAHDTNPTLDLEYGQCPLLAELAVVRAIPWRVPPLIFIDDLPLFEAERYRGRYALCDRTQFPHIDDIRRAIPSEYTLLRRRQWHPLRAISNLKHIGRLRYYSCRPAARRWRAEN